MVTVVHTIGVTGKEWRRKGEQFTPELLWLLGVGLVVRRDYSSRRTAVTHPLPTEGLVQRLMLRRAAKILPAGIGSFIGSRAGAP